MKICFVLVISSSGGPLRWQLRHATKFGTCYVMEDDDIQLPEAELIEGPTTIFRSLRFYLESISLDTK